MMRRTTIFVRLFILLCVLGIVVGCGGKSDSEQPSSTLTKAQRDSVLAASKLPGAKTVGRSLAISDSAKARADRLDDDQP
jgi:hypothetical protein